MTFVDDKTLRKLSHMGPSEIDELDFGVVRVDDYGRVEMYNDYETRFANISFEAAFGKNFFTQIAPCTNNRLIYGRFKDGILAGELDVSVRYTFTYKMRPTLVLIRLYRDPETKANFVLVKRVGAPK